MRAKIWFYYVGCNLSVFLVVVVHEIKNSHTDFKLLMLHKTAFQCTSATGFQLRQLLTNMLIRLISRCFDSVVEIFVYS